MSLLWLGTSWVLWLLSDGLGTLQGDPECVEGSSAGLSDVLEWKFEFSVCRIASVAYTIQHSDNE